MKLTETELLKLQNNSLKAELVAAERQALYREFVAKYGKPGDKDIKITADGTILETPALASVPEGA